MRLSRSRAPRFIALVAAATLGACASSAPATTGAPTPQPRVETPPDASVWVEIEGKGTVDAAVERLVAAVTEAGLNYFVSIDHGAGARGVGAEFGDMKLVIFGSPKIGSRLMQADPRVGNELPLRVLVRQAGPDGVGIGFVSPLSFAARYDLATVADTLVAMDKALRKFAAAALAP